MFLCLILFFEIKPKKHFLANLTETLPVAGANQTTQERSGQQVSLNRTKRKILIKNILNWAIGHTCCLDTGGSTQDTHHGPPSCLSLWPFTGRISDQDNRGWCWIQNEKIIQFVNKNTDFRQLKEGSRKASSWTSNQLLWQVKVWPWQKNMLT